MPGYRTIDALVVDDIASFREIVRSIVDPHYVRFVGEASDGLEAIQKAEELKPDLILLDIGLPQLNGIEVAKRVLQCLPHTLIVFVSMHCDHGTVREALDTGAKGYVLKGAAGRELGPAIQAVFNGGEFVSKQLVDAHAVA